MMKSAKCDHNLNLNLVLILLCNIGLYNPTLNFKVDHDLEIMIFSHSELRTDPWTDPWTDQWSGPRTKPGH